MYPAPFNYHRPASLPDALRLLQQFNGEAVVLAGGQSLIPMMKLRVGEFRDLIDIGRLPELSYIEQRAGMLHIGALARHAQIAASGAAASFAILGDVAGGIADRQVRTMGTIGGGLSIADASGCWPCGLFAMDARVVCSSPGGSRTVPVTQFILGSYSTCLAADEMVTEVQIPLPQGASGSAYVAFKRSAATYPTVAAAMVLELDGERCRNVRLVLGGAGPAPVASAAAESILGAKRIDRNLLVQAADAIVAESAPSPDARGSEAFKRAMLRSLVVDAGMRALARARGEQVAGGHRYA